MPALAPVTEAAAGTRCVSVPGLLSHTHTHYVTEERRRAGESCAVEVTSFASFSDRVLV